MMERDKQNFLIKLEEALSGGVPAHIVKENVAYYNSYITDEARKNGISEAEVINRLGSPALIARSIEDAYNADWSSGSGSRSQGWQYQGSQPENPYNKEQNSSGYGSVLDHMLHINGGCLIALVLVLLMVFTVGITLLRFAFTFPGLVILLILYYLFRRNSRR